MHRYPGADFLRRAAAVTGDVLATGAGVAKAMEEMNHGGHEMVQFKCTEYGDALGGGKDAAVQFGVVFSFDARFNDNVDERNSILNLEHSYIQ